MFDGEPDQFHQFISPRNALPLHLSFPLHTSASTSNSFLPFDPYKYNPTYQLPLQATLLHPLHHQSPTHKDEEKEANSMVSSINFEIGRDQGPELTDSWTNDEVLALLSIKSSMESCFPELTWEHVSRKLAELGFKKSAEKCKEKFEDESKYFNNIIYGKNCRFLSGIEELYQGEQNPDRVVTEKNLQQQLEKPREGRERMGHALEEDSRNIDPPVTKPCDGSDQMVEKSRNRKRKRRDKFETFKGFCENIVNKMMAQQEEIHNKLLEDMLKRDEEKFAREEAWKKQELDRMNKELEKMAQEQAIAGDRHATIIEFMKKYAASTSTSQNFRGGIRKCKTNGSNRNSQRNHSSPLHSQNPNPSTGENNNLKPTPSSNMILNHETNGNSHAQNNSALPVTWGTLPAENPSSSDALQVPSSSNSSPAPQNPSSSLNSQNNPLESNSLSTYKASLTPLSTNEREDVGRRWPKNEVLALINLRCTSVNNINNNEDKEGNKASLWERISQGMSELGYKRSAKRCKEKWENINKYFRKTKDVDKKRSLDSRTCPYFHQLRSLYSQGKLVSQSERSEKHFNPTANSGQVPPDHAQAESSQVGSDGFSMHVHHGAKKTLIQAPPLDFD